MKTRMLILLMAILLLTGCGGVSEDDIVATQTFESALKTAVAETLQAELVAAETEAFPEATQPPAVVENTPEPTPTFTVVPPTLVPTIPPAASTEAPNSTEGPPPCYRAELISEKIPDGTIFTPGKGFTKVWVIRNTGVCEWTEDFTWELVEGEDFGANTTFKLNRSVMPGEDLEVKIVMKTPRLEGGYRGTYQIFTEEGGSVTPSGFWLYIISQN